MEHRFACYLSASIQQCRWIICKSHVWLWSFRIVVPRLTNKKIHVVWFRYSRKTFKNVKIMKGIHFFCWVNSFSRQILPWRSTVSMDFLFRKALAPNNNTNVFISLLAKETEWTFRCNFSSFKLWIRLLMDYVRLGFSAFKIFMLSTRILDLRTISNGFLRRLFQEFHFA